MSHLLHKYFTSVNMTKKPNFRELYKLCVNNVKFDANVFDKHCGSLKRPFILSHAL